MELYQLDATQFAQQIKVEPTSFCQLMALQPVEAEVVLAVIDQLHQNMKLNFEWFLTYDLAIIPDLSECLGTLLYNRDGMARRIKARRETVQWMLHGLIDELGSGIADPDSREVYSSNWTMGKLE
ncbi:hypothetical protein [Spirosoma jeollabukense]